MKITIIGAGLGGLTFGALAVRDGHTVEIYDKNSAPGGVVALLEHEGYTRPSRPRSMLRLPTSPRLWPPSPSRTTSVSMTSFPA